MEKEPVHSCTLPLIAPTHNIAEVADELISDSCKLILLKGVDDPLWQCLFVITANYFISDAAISSGGYGNGIKTIANK